MQQQYDYAQDSRVVWVILTPALFLLWIFFLGLAWASHTSDARGILLVISLLTWPLLMWGVLFLVLSAMRVQLQETAVTLHLRHHTRTIPYDTITAVSRYHPWHSIDQDFQTYQHNRYVKADQKLSPGALLCRLRAFG